MVEEHHVIVDVPYLASVPVDPFTLNIVVVVCNPYLGVMIVLNFFSAVSILHEQTILLLNAVPPGLLSPPCTRPSSCVLWREMPVQIEKGELNWLSSQSG